MNNPMVSVIMPVYNGEKYIRKALESILNQTFQDFELIIIDDCGNDSSMIIVNEYKDSRIRVFHNNVNKGIAFSRNRAIQESKGKYIAIMDDDDISHQDRLLYQVDFMEKNSFVDVAGGQSSIIDEEDNVIAPPELMQESTKMNKVMFLFYNSFHNSETIIRKKIVDEYKIRYSDNMLGMEDFKFWIECSLHGRISNVNKEILKYRVTKDNETSRVRRIQEDARKNLFNKLRQYSLLSNGYHLERKELNILNTVVNESGDGVFRNSYQVMGLFQIMSKIIGQAKEMRVDYLDELQMWLKITFNNKFSGSLHVDIWN